MRVSVVIPVYNEAAAVGLVLNAIPRDTVEEIIVVDNGSDDGSGEVARQAGARVVREERRGYGRACLAGIAALSPATEIVAFLDGDYSDYPEELPELVAPIREGRADFVVGSRVLGERERGALVPQARLGNWIATRLIARLWGVRYTDLGPFRAIARESLRRLRMRDPAFGWTVEMQIKAAMIGLRSVEVPVRYRRRIGRSKVSGTVSGVVRAGMAILGTIVYYWNWGRGRPFETIRESSDEIPS
jgi:glycosyltransferase involved in cell wall biosynthesis